MSITSDDFHRACAALAECWEDTKPRNEWQDVKVIDTYGTQYLQISKYVGAGTRQGAHHDLGNDEITEDDNETLMKTVASDRELLLVFDIVHSGSYQVPVLYLRIKDSATPTAKMPSLEEVYELLVPTEREFQMHSVGVMGAITMTEHPVLGTTTYFVHPCQTAEAMNGLVEGKSVEPLGYLLLWIGLIGASVGLNVPVEVAEAVSKSKSNTLPTR